MALTTIDVQKLTQKLKDIFKWIRDNLLAVLLVSFVIPGVLAVFNQQAEITKTIYEVDYKAAKGKYLECNSLHSDFLAAVSANANNAQLLHDHFNLDSIVKYGMQEAYFVAFRSAMEGFQTSGIRVNDMANRTSRCYSELYGIYENLALMLDVNTKYQDIKKRDAEKVAKLAKKVEATRVEMMKQVDVNQIYRAMISGDQQGMLASMKTINFGSIAKIEYEIYEAESAVQAQQQAIFYGLNIMFSEELSKRFHRGLFSYFRSLFSI